MNYLLIGKTEEEKEIFFKHLRESVNDIAQVTEEEKEKKSKNLKSKENT